MQSTVSSTADEILYLRIACDLTVDLSSFFRKAIKSRSPTSRVTSSAALPVSTCPADVLGFLVSDPALPGAGEIHQQKPKGLAIYQCHISNFYLIFRCYHCLSGASVQSKFTVKPITT